MAQLIKETIERWCCQPQDLVAYGADVFSDKEPHYKICKHCSTFFERHSVVDAAGSRDYEYREIPWPLQSVARLDKSKG